MLLVVSWGLAVAIMALIFYFSSRQGEASTAQSNFFLDFFRETLHLNVNEFFIRKLAHTAEFALLGLIISNAYFHTFQKRKPILSFLTASAYAATDEFHQLFVEGRACSAVDWMIDSFGVLLGVAFFTICLWLFRRICFNRRKSI